MRIRFHLIATPLLAAACGAGADDRPASRAAATSTGAASAATAATPIGAMRGTVTGDASGWRIRPCATDSTLSLRDAADVASIHAAVAGADGAADGVFFALTGRISDGTVAALEVAAVSYAAVEGRGCDSDWRFRWRAGGNEPFWSATVVGDTLRFEEPGAAPRAWTGLGIRTVADSTRIVTGDAETGARLTLARRACRDSMSGAWSSLTARLRIDGRTLEGCAVPGDGT